MLALALLFGLASTAHCFPVLEHAVSHPDGDPLAIDCVAHNHGRYLVLEVEADPYEGLDVIGLLLPGTPRGPEAEAYIVLYPRTGDLPVRTGRETLSFLDRYLI